MKRGKFFDLTIKGVGLNVDELRKTVGLPCDIYVKGEKTAFEFTNREHMQKTDRWVYTAIAQDEIPINKFLTKQLEIIDKKMSVMRKYIEDYYAVMELVIYVEEKTNTFNILLSKKVIRLLNRINVKFSVTFIDW